MFKKILIANRGEIAVRVIRACREMGITSAAIYSEADKTSLHTRMADESYYIGPSISSQSYLNKEKIIKLAKEIDADAVHPGYGFFSENADFIKALEVEDIAFIGPSSKSVEMMGSKTSARSLMQKSGVPIVPGTTEQITSLKEGIRSAGKIGFPVLLKAATGGGGKGMRKIYSESEFQDAFEAVKREALKSFGDESIYIEKYIENPRHIEVQIIGDKHGNYIHLFERECSIQRRHQKVIEESPSSYVDGRTREKITEAAINAAKACDYYNAGTIEFLMESGITGANEKSFYFLEMNTRLQVEHPVTEMITGIDLVKEQIAIAAGGRLSFKQEDIKINGHAFESRIYAEDPDNSFLPSTGKIYEYKTPSGPGVRLDGGLDAGSEVSVFYDPLIAKLICWAGDRQSAIKRMNRALEEYKIGGVRNNISFLKSVFNNAEFINGNIDINFLERIFENNAPELYSDGYGLPEVAAAILTALKNEKSFGIKKTDKYNSAPKNLNKWTEMLYE